MTCLVTFGGIMLSMFMILWIERKFYARVNDRRGATTSSSLTMRLEKTV